MAFSTPFKLQSHRFLLKSILIILFFLLSPALHRESQTTLHRRELREANTNSQPTETSPHAAFHCRTVRDLPRPERCTHAKLHCGGNTNSLFNYATLHYCYLNDNSWVSVSILVGVVILEFYILATTAEHHFSRVVGRMAALLRLSPSMGGVTLLALGNGAPDVFASIAAMWGDNPRIGLGAILSAGTFVSAFVVGFVALTAAPFAVKPFPFVRDVFFYMVAATTLFYVYLSGVVFLWQAVGLVLFYLLFVAVVFWMDQLGSRGQGEEMHVCADMNARDSGFGVRVEEGLDKWVDFVPTGALDGPAGRKHLGGFGKLSDKALFQPVNSAGEMMGGGAGSNCGSGCWVCGKMGKLTQIWEVPVKLLLKLTIPSINSSEWSRFYASANIVLCPVALLYFCSSFIPFHYPVVFLLPNIHFPMWMVVLAQSFSIGFAHYLIVSEPPAKEKRVPIVVAFVMSVCWISIVAGELLGCLAALGVILKLPPALLGLTVLAWGNSVGDLVADVAVAKAGQPAMAMAGCFAGPMFNMLIGLGLALVMRTAHAYPSGYHLHFHISIVVAFGFLFMSLLGSLLVITWSRFQVPRFWGFCLIALYVIFIAMSLMIANVM